MKQTTIIFTCLVLSFMACSDRDDKWCTEEDEVGSAYADSNYRSLKSYAIIREALLEPKNRIGLSFDSFYEGCYLSSGVWVQEIPLVLHQEIEIFVAPKHSTIDSTYATYRIFGGDITPLEIIK